ncbi:hypothetical protein Pla123a_22810 [Posidoniimonas polymericola]|uniref:Uncharacterized protein n=1 Tax=Posidoniimonas polymericola TaxID=2528002 RepID=A0A5C5YPY9_9BACT|nr:hypothetical protein [Posidoniimonas polymericola]TWT76858.1 hypothetical protein Pla123a_22810 [Posidoniimonas polymericola]
MSREIESIARVLQRMLSTGKGRAPTPLLLVGCLLIGGYLFLEPTLEASWGVDLPGVHAYPSGGPAAERDGNPSGGGKAPPTPNRQGEASRSGGPKSGGSSVEDLIRSDRETYTSPAGLTYSRGTQHGHHLRHLMAHAEDDPDRPGQHGVFDSDDVQTIVDLVDEAYRMALDGDHTRKRQEGDRTIYVVDMGRRIGYVGGQSGERRGHPAAHHLQMVLVGRKLITSYPLIP